MADHIVKTWHGSVRKSMRAMQQRAKIMQNLSADRRKGRAGEDYLTQITNGSTLNATLVQLELQLTTLLAQTTTLH